MIAQAKVVVPPTKIYFPEADVASLQKVLGDILRSGQLTLGKHTQAFEQAFAPISAKEYAVAVNSGTSALEITLRALKLSDAEIVVPTNTFAASAFAVLHSGNRVVLADVGPDLCLSLDALEHVVSRRTRAVVLVHIGGLVACESAKISDFCSARGIYLVEDAAHAHGSTLDGRPAGSFGHASAFSFYPTKVITAAEGGMIATDDVNLASSAKVFRDQGKAGFGANLHVELGYNWRMSEIHAAIGLSQLTHLQEFIERRRSIANVYTKGLRNLSGLSPLTPSPGVASNYYKFIALLGQSVDRPSFKVALRNEHGIALAGEVYETPLHRQPVFQDLGLGRDSHFETAEQLCERHVCLPMSAAMTDDEATRVVEACKEVLASRP